MQRKTLAIFIFSVLSPLFSTNMVQAFDWGQIRWKNTKIGYEICLKATSPTGYVEADHCRDNPQYRWRFDKKEKCLENEYYAGKCLTEIWDEAVLSPRNGPETFTNEIQRKRESSPPEQFYWLKEDTGENEKWCLTIEDNGEPLWNLFYMKCHNEMQAQQFVFVPTTDGWSKIMRKTKHGNDEICLSGTGPTDNVIANTCGYSFREQWRFHEDDNCLENRYYGGKCLAEVWDEAVLSPRHGIEKFTNEILSNLVSAPLDDYYWLKENTGENEKWCLTIDYSGDPPWDLYYSKCQENRQTQKFVVEDNKPPKPKKTNPPK